MKGRSWVAEAKSMVMENLDQISTLPILALQTLAMHDVHEADITSAWNLTGMMPSLVVLGALP